MLKYLFDECNTFGDMILLMIIPKNSQIYNYVICKYNKSREFCFIEFCSPQKTSLNR